MSQLDDRRRHRRVPMRVRFSCRRLGRGGFDEEVESLDLSAGGALILADRRIGVGDVLALVVETGDLAVSLRGLVVGTRPIPLDHNRRMVHVAFTGMSPEGHVALGQVIERWEDTHPSTA